MSKTYSKLSDINKLRAKPLESVHIQRELVASASGIFNKSGKIVLKKNPPMPTSNQKEKAEVNKTKDILRGGWAKWVILVLCVLIAVLSLFNIKTYQAMQGVTSENILVAQKLSKIEALLENSHSVISGISGQMEDLKEDLKNARQDAKTALQRVSELEKKVDGQVFVIENLVKVKDRLVPAVERLEKEKLKVLP